nr:DUF616 domain-containing protein [Pseudomonas sp. ANT_J12]
MPRPGNGCGTGDVVKQGAGSLLLEGDHAFSAADLPDTAFLDTALIYRANEVDLTVSRNQASFADVAATGNQRGVASALSRNGLAGAELQNQIVNLSGAGAVFFSAICGFLWRGGLPPLGCDATLKPETPFIQTYRLYWFHDCCAAERGKPLATVNGWHSALC